MRAALLLLLCSGATVADAFHAGAGVGVGGAYDVAGARVELGVDRFSLLLGFGIATAHEPGHALSIGARWSLTRPESGPAFGAHLITWQAPARNPYESSDSIVAVSATFTWRWRPGPGDPALGPRPPVLF